MNVPSRETHAYVAHLRIQHQHVRDALRQLMGLLDNATGDAQWAAKMRQRLADLRDQLKQHFDTEAEGGYLEEACVYHPELSGEMQRILSEHEGLLSELDRAVDQCESARSSPNAIQESVRQLAERLAAHEDAENRLLLQAFGESPE